MIQTSVKEAAVYRSGCIVKRQAVLPLQAGRQTVTFPEMSPGMDQNSLRLLVPAGSRTGAQAAGKPADGAHKQR